MTYSDNYNIRTKNVKFNDVADAIDGILTRTFGGTTAGTSSAYIATPSPTWTAYSAGELLTIIPHVANATSATLDVSGLGPIAIRRNGTGITANVFTANSPVLLLYNGVQFDVIAVDSSGSTGAPTGQITSFGGVSAPSGWLVCDGTDYNTYTYRVLHAVVSNIYGGTAYLAGTTDQPAAVTTFKVPDLRRRVAIGTGASDTLGFTEGGNNTGTAYASRTTAHTHTVPAHYHGLGTLAVTTSGGHGHTTHTSAVVDIQHSHAPSSVSGSVGGADGLHQHTIANRSGNANVGSAAVVYVLRGGNLNQGGATGTTLAGTLEGGHGHSFSLTAAGQTLGATNRSVTGTVGGSDGTHSHTLSGSVGLVATGSNGDAAFATGSVTPPLLFINYIIKA